MTEVHEGDVFSIKGKFTCTIRYVGPYHLQPGTWYGIELSVPKGKLNGMVHGKRYFNCPDGHGLFVDEKDLKKLIGNAQPSGNEEVKRRKSNIVLSSTRKDLSESELAIDQKPSGLNSPNVQSFSRSQEKFDIQTPKKASNVNCKSDEVNENQMKELTKDESACDEFSTPNNISQSDAPTPKKIIEHEKQVEFNPTPIKTHPNSNEVKMAKLKKAQEVALKQLEAETKRNEDLKKQLDAVKKHNKEKEKIFYQKILKSKIEFESKSLQKEEELLEALQKEKQAKAESLKQVSSRKAVLLEEIHREYLNFELKIHEIFTEQEMNIDKKKEKKDKLEQELLQINDCNSKLQTDIDLLKTQIEKCDLELNNQKPIEQEIKGLKLKNASLQESIKKKQKANESFKALSSSYHNFIQKTSPSFNQTYFLSAQIERLSSESLLIPQLSQNYLDNAIMENIQHFCQLVRLVLMNFSTSSKPNIDMQLLSDLSSELEAVENVLIAKNIPVFDLEHFMNILQKSTPIVLHQVITPHLFNSASILAQSEETRRIFKQFSKKLPPMIYPDLITKQSHRHEIQEKCQKITLDLKNQLRKAEKNEPVDLEKIDLKEILPFLPNADSSFFNKQIKFGRNGQDFNDIDQFDAEEKELNRQIRDLSAIIKIRKMKKKNTEKTTSH